MSLIEHLQFPSGTKISQARKDAKKYKRKYNCTQNQALNFIATQNGIDLPWDKAVKVLKETQENLFPDLFSDCQFLQLRNILSHKKGIVIFSGSGKRTVVGAALDVCSYITAKEGYSPPRSIMPKEFSQKVLTLNSEIEFIGDLRQSLDLERLIEGSTSSLRIATINAPTLTDATQHLVNLALVHGSKFKVKAIVHCSRNNNQLSVEITPHPHTMLNHDYGELPEPA